VINKSKVGQLNETNDCLSFPHIRGKVARVLLDSADVDTGRNHLATMGEIALSLNTSSKMVNKSLLYLQEKGAIRLEHRKISVNSELLRKIAAGLCS
jgi:hypothetical protein